MDYMKADVCFVIKKNKKSGRLIRWFTQRRGEKSTKASHVGMIVIIDGVVYVIEALFRVKTIPIEKWKKKNPNYEIWRNTDLTDEQRYEIQRRSFQYNDNFYGFGKIALHGIDCLIAKVTGKDWFIFRRLQFIDKFPICNWLVAYSYYDVTRYIFTYPPKFTDPDSMHDHVRKRNNSFVLVEKAIKS
ncbi:MAG: hypothetical protein ACOCQD_00600 [archaeon]